MMAEVINGLSNKHMYVYTQVFVCIYVYIYRFLLSVYGEEKGQRKREKHTEGEHHKLILAEIQTMELLSSLILKYTLVIGGKEEEEEHIKVFASTLSQRI